ncbi:short-chain fatty acyl-CoA regulator family protein [Sphingomonas sp. H39-1-10]|uniref:helix-turn-helix domain-containing protein n=1 Tax=Sphingomonas pollutisoli TaxID=3030829 RepID=UPI0023B8D367|nr:XRE family transcriptional regulator [Sphingomonas pollutisoli]MDF0487898.1 short-chain fatty acyl-CoA regulator family protein [Sphingomonas pollutisoli]
MAPAGDRKLYLGPRLRLLRRDLGLNQTQMAEELGVSPSYLNHLERNQRPFTAQMLLRLADTYDIDMRGFVAAANEASSSDLHEIFADALVRDIGVPRQEVLEVAENYPGVAEAMTRLYRALADLRQMPERVESAGLAGTRVASPLAWLRDWLDARRNHFADLDAAAETISAALGDDPDAMREAMARRLRDDHGVAVRIVGREVLGDAIRHYDYHRRRLMLAETLSASDRLFEIASRLAIEDLSGPLAAATAAADAPDAETRGLAQQTLTSYAAAAIVMPYGRFHAAAEASRYDMDLLSARFGVSYEQAAHRLTTLDRPGARGVPLFLLKLDTAGNVAKRFSGETMPLARFGGGCPRWRVHRAFRRLGETVTDRVEMPDGASYFTWARAVMRGEGREPAVIVLGCEAKHAARIGYGDASAGVTRIGPACHLCERTDCTDRSLPPITRSLDLNPIRKARVPYPFRAI